VGLGRDGKGKRKDGGGKNNTPRRAKTSKNCKRGARVNHERENLAREEHRVVSKERKKEWNTSPQRKDMNLVGV